LNLSFLSQKAFGSSVSHYLHLRQRRLNVNAKSACPSEAALHQGDPPQGRSVI
jgi:hypothetical protein